MSRQLLNDPQSDFTIRSNKLIFSRQASILPALIKNLHNDNTGVVDNNMQIIKSPTQNYRIFITPLSYEQNTQHVSTKDSARQYVIHINKYKDVLHIESQLKDIYDLTAAEARLANSIINGLTLEEIAEQGDLKYSTLKSYLKIIFQKTATKKQHELVSAILRNFTCTL